ncbi:putative RNA methyltransferase [Cucumis melo var. makuwa]|uniref:RNA methyltransferase n=1 Tax=Cucumis melo var. makuwa TaxID=1194695 RepID=A0A5D3E740_CUCMM|nr:putative RNA methyltransferase [Cucumis melo var. makuwa]TYK31381.1 putative RNA methyltransferase [Cucumis melo var. makuwa]
MAVRRDLAPPPSSSVWCFVVPSYLPILTIRAVPIRVLTVGKKRSRGVQLLVDEYIDKLKNYCHVEDVQLRSNPRNARDPKAQIDDEDVAVVNLLKSDDWVVMLDENGKEISSEQMAELVADAGNTGASRLSFCIGGPYGHGQKLRERANLSIKLSSMVMDYSKRSEVPSLAAAVQMPAYRKVCRLFWPKHFPPDLSFMNINSSSTQQLLEVEINYFRHHYA